jgi:uncharacterized integral membrane protein
MAGEDDASELAGAKAGPGKGFPPWLVAVIIVGIVSVVFIMQNRTRVKVHFILFDRQARTWVVILISMALGALLAEVVRLAVKRRRGAQVSRPDST